MSEQQGQGREQDRPRGHDTAARVRSLDAAQRRRRVAQLYLRRISQVEIAKQLGIGQATVSRDIQALKDEWRRESVDAVGDVILREAAVLDELERDCALLWPGSTDTDQRLRIVDRRLKIQERRAKLLGLDAPERRELSGPEGADLFTGLEAALLKLYGDAADAGDGEPADAEDSEAEPGAADAGE